MDARHITSLIEATRKVFDTMLQMTVEFGEPSLTDAMPAECDVSGIIGFSGDMVGAVVLSFPTKTAEKVVSAFANMRITADSDVFADAVGELANMIAGVDKSQYEDRSVTMSCPSVVIGKSHRVPSVSDNICISLPCRTPVGPFAIARSIQKAHTAAKPSPNSAAA